MRISDWSSDVCSSDLQRHAHDVLGGSGDPADLVAELLDGDPEVFGDQGFVFGDEDLRQGASFRPGSAVTRGRTAQKQGCSRRSLPAITRPPPAASLRARPKASQCRQSVLYSRRGRQTKAEETTSELQSLMSNS